MGDVENTSAMVALSQRDGSGGIHALVPEASATVLPIADSLFGARRGNTARRDAYKVKRALSLSLSLFLPPSLSLSRAP